jgi:predicted histidine transporter YuiF (NhaC family)
LNGQHLVIITQNTCNIVLTDTLRPPCDCGSSVAPVGRVFQNCLLENLKMRTQISKSEQLVTFSTCIEHVEVLSGVGGGCVVYRKERVKSSALVHC